MRFDLTGKRHDKDIKVKIDLTGFGVIGDEGADLQPTENPHEVTEMLAQHLIHTGRAVEHDPDNPIGPNAKRPERKAAGAGVVQNGDPKAAKNGDPKAAKNGDPKAAKNGDPKAAKDGDPASTSSDPANPPA